MLNLLQKTVVSEVHQSSSFQPLTWDFYTVAEGEIREKEEIQMLIYWHLLPIFWVRTMFKTFILFNNILNYK